MVARRSFRVQKCRRLAEVGIADGIRTATKEDLDRIAAIDHIAASGDSGRLSVLDRAVYSGRCLVYADQSGIAGFVVANPNHFFGRDFVELLVVAPSVRRSGVGRTLLRAAVNASCTHQVFTSTNESNDAMRSLLSSEGWVFSGQLNGLDEGDPELVFFTLRSAMSAL